MQNRFNWTCYTARVKRKSFFISLFLHLSFFTLIFFSPVKEKKKFEREIFTVKLISLPQIKEEVRIENFISFKNVKDIKPEKTKNEKIESVKQSSKISESFSPEDYRKKVYSKITKEEKAENLISQRNIDIKIPDVKSILEEVSPSQIKSTSFIPEWYISLIKKKIEENWSLKSFLVGLSAIISFRIYREGKVENIVIEKSSGYKKFDDSILEAIKSVKKWPEFPEEIKDRYLDITVEFKTEG